MNKDVAQELARRLEGAEHDKVQIAQFSAEYPDMTIADAYDVQRAWMQIKLAAGRRSIGRKIGLTSRAMQRAVNITEPDYGLLLDNMLFENGAEIPCGHFIQPRVEVELAFVLGHKLEGPGLTIFDVLRAAEYVVPALEILDARMLRVDPVTKRTRTVIDTISDNAANAGIVLGGRPIRPTEIDLRWVAAILYRNGIIEETGVAAAVLDHPANGVAWLANRLSPYGESLQPGEIILAGSFTAPVDARTGDVFHVDYGPLGNATVRFA